MRPPVTEYLDSVARQCVPFGITLFLVVASAVAVPIQQYGAVASAAALMSIYYWTVYRDNLMPAVAVFTIGLLQDILGGTPLGLSALVLLLGYALIRSQQRFLQGKSFIVHWAGVVVFARGFVAENQRLRRRTVEQAECHAAETRVRERALPLDDEQLVVGVVQDELFGRAAHEV